jgi:hypothetical protein
MRRRLAFWAFVFVLLAAPAAVASTIIVNQQGSTNPALNGFTNNVGGPVYGTPVGTTAWNMQGSWPFDYNQYVLSSTQITDVNAASNWELTATFNNLSAGTGIETGTYAGVILNDLRFDLALNSDGTGDQVLTVDSFTGSPSYTIAGLGTNPVTLELLYNKSTSTANVFVNGTEVISNYAGYSESYSNIVLFGGVDGNFSHVELETNVSTVPEPATFTLMATGLVGLVGLGSLRRWRATSH